MKLQFFPATWSKTKKVLSWIVVYVALQTFINGTLQQMNARQMPGWTLVAMTFALFGLLTNLSLRKKGD